MVLMISGDLWDKEIFFIMAPLGKISRFSNCQLIDKQMTYILVIYILLLNFLSYWIRNVFYAISIRLIYKKHGDKVCFLSRIERFYSIISL